MKKSKLIELLLKLEGDPEVLLWNGFVSDWVDIGSVIEYDLVKQTFEDYCRRVEYEEKRNRLSWEYKLSEEEIKGLKKHYRKVCKWEVNEFVDEEQLQKNTIVARELYSSTPNKSTWKLGTEWVGLVTEGG